jgi:hypothetical protein
MRFVKTAIIAGVASAALAGAAFAAHEKSKIMLVALPDGTVEHIRYTGDVAPQVVVVPAAAAAPAEMFDAAFGSDSAFAEMDRMAAAMEARSQAMMREAAMMQAQMPAANQGQGIVMTNARGEPVGVMHYSYVSSSTDANGCTQTVQYSSDGANAVNGADQPRVIRTSAGNCGAPEAVGKASPVTPTAAQPAAKPEPRITPVSEPRPAQPVTTSRT